MPTHYQVQQGDYLSKIAAENGVSDYKTIWDYPDNAALKKKRKNPNVLLPGDILVIPDKQDRQESRATGKSHVFQTNQEPLKLRVRLGYLYCEQPLTATAYCLDVESQKFAKSTDGNGQIEHEIPSTAQQATLTYLTTTLSASVGSLDPASEPSGQLARLVNLGYYLGDPNASASDSSQSDPAAASSDPDGTSDTGGTDPDDPDLRSAIEEFQCDQQLTVDGICGPQTQAQLIKVHGC